MNGLAKRSVKLFQRLVSIEVAATTAAVVPTIALGYLDYFTGREWAISAFYLVPISLASWVAGAMVGIDCGGLVYLFGVL